LHGHIAQAANDWRNGYDQLLQIDVETEKTFLKGHLKPERDDDPEMKGNYSMLD